MKDSFWTGGANAYYKGLREEYESRQRELQVQLDAASDVAELTRIESELAALKAEYARRRRRIGSMLY